MPTYRPIPQISPEANNYTQWYSCPSGNAIINTVNVCNFSSNTAQFQIYLVTGATTGQSGQYLADLELTSKNVFNAVQGWILNSGHKLYAQSNITGLAFNAFVKEF